MQGPSICVVGSINLDMNTYVAAFPRPGETIHGVRFTIVYGGKGANLAVMAARVGGAVQMVGRVGDDMFGQEMLRNLDREGVDTRAVRVSPGFSSGVAVITVEASGQNQIVVVAGANGQVTADDLDGALGGAVQVLVCQMEVPMAANLAALRLARAAGVQTIFNPAPGSSAIPEEVYGLADIFCPNESEAELLTGVAVHSIEDARRAAAELRRRGAAAALITLGERGCLYVDEFQEVHVAAPLVTAVDTTGAGDAFVGSLAFFLAEGVPIVAAIERAQAIAAISVQSPGAQSSYPRRAALPAALL